MQDCDHQNLKMRQDVAVEAVEDTLDCLAEDSSLVVQAERLTAHEEEASCATISTFAKVHIPSS